MEARKFSKQRESIREYLSSVDTHPTADEIYAAVRKSHPNLSLATVYRNLNQMAEAGEVLKLSHPGLPDRFDARTDEHCHFECTKCGRMYDVFLDDKIRECIFSAELPGKAETIDLRYYGICKNCSAEEK